MAKSQKISALVNAPAFAAYADVATSLPTGAATKVLFQQENFDTAGNFASSRFTATVAGYYQINARVQCNGSITNALAMIYKNGSIFAVGTADPGSFSSPIVGVSGLVYLNGSTDYVEIFVSHSTGSSVNTVVSDASITRFDGCLVRVA